MNLNIKSRLRRRDYFISMLIAWSIVFFMKNDSYDSSPGIINSVIAIIALIFILIQVFRRTEDAGYNSLFALFILIPLVGTIYMVLLLFKDGTIGPNQYGEDPKRRIPPTPVTNQGQ